MKNNLDLDLFNAAVVGENPKMSFLIFEGDCLHAVEPSVAEQKKGQHDPTKEIALMRAAFRALGRFAQGKVEDHLLEIDWTGLENQPGEREELILKICRIFEHLPHHARNELSTLVHHKQPAAR